MGGACGLTGTMTVCREPWGFEDRGLTETMPAWRSRTSGLRRWSGRDQDDLEELVSEWGLWPALEHDGWWSRDASGLWPALDHDGWWSRGASGLWSPRDHDGCWRCGASVCGLLETMPAGGAAVPQGGGLLGNMTERGAVGPQGRWRLGTTTAWDGAAVS